MKQLPQHRPEQTNGQKPPQKRDLIRKRLPKLTLKRLGLLALGLVTLLVIVSVFRPTPIAVETGQVERGKLQVTVNAEGKTRVRDRFIVAANVNGQLERIELEEGDPVNVGTLVARIEPLPLNAAVKQALGRLEEAKAQRAGVATQRPKPEALSQATARINAAQANQRQAEARVAQAQAALEQARRDRQRAQELQAAGVIPRQERETAQLNETTRAKELEAATRAAQASAAQVAAAEKDLALLKAEQSDPDYLLRVYDAQIASIEAELSQLQDDARRTEIRSPVQGRVLRILQKSAQFVTEGTPLLELGDATQLELVIDVLSQDAEMIQPNDPIWIEQRGERPPLQAKVTRIEPSAFTKVSALGVEEQRVNVIGDFVEPPQTLGDAYRVDTKIVTWEDENALKLPLSALFRCDRPLGGARGNQAWCVFVVRENKAHRRQIEVGHRSDLEAEVKQGLTTGERVILHPTEQIQDGKRVKTR
jgi:HlyD family secretion protein